MNANEREALSPLVRKLDRLGALTPADKDLLQALPFTVREAAAICISGVPALERSALPVAN